MKLVRTISMIIALAGASTATVHAQAPGKKAPAKEAPAKGELSPAEVKKAEAFFDELHDAVVKNQDACPKMATRINAVFNKHEAWLKKVVESGKDLPQATKDKVQKRQQEMVGGLMKCKDDKDVLTAFQRFATLMQPKAEAAPAPPPPPPAKK